MTKVGLDPGTPGWRGVHVMDAGASALPLVLRMVRESLAPAGANALVYELDYNFSFHSAPELAGKDPWDAARVRELVAGCRAEGVQVIPQLNCLGHQSWLEPPGPFLRAYPEYEELPDGRTAYTTLGSGKFYCRSWCPRHPGVHRVVFGVLDELTDAFKTGMFHVGMDEVFVLSSDACPRCRGTDPAETFAAEVAALAGHLKHRGQTVLLWADRLIDGTATGMGMWEASEQGTAPALELIPRDLILCDWHYEGGVRGAFPSLDLFRKRGFKVWPSVWKSMCGATAFMEAAKRRADPGVLGVLATTWYSVRQIANAVLGEPAEEEARVAAATMLAVLRGASEG